MHCNTERQGKQAERNYLYSTFIKNNYPQRCIVQTSKKIGTHLTEHNDAIKRYDISGHFPLDTHMAIVTHLTEHTLNY